MAVSVSSVDHEEQLHKAILQDDVPQAKAVLEIKPTIINKRCRDAAFSPMYIALTRALSNTNSQMTEALLEAGGDLHVCTCEYMRTAKETPIVTTTKLGYKTLLDTLLRFHIIDNDIESRLSYTALYHAARRGDTDVVKKLIDHGFDVNWVCSGFNTALHVAASKGYDDIVRVLLEKNAEPSPNITKKMPLHMATQYGHLNVVKTLIGHGEDIDAEDGSSFTPLMIACVRNYPEITEYLLQQGARVNTSREHHASPYHAGPLFVAAYHGRINIVCMLIEHGALVNCKNDWDKTPLHLAASRGHIDTVQTLIQHGADMEATDTSSETALKTALLSSQDTTARLLIKHGANFCVENFLLHPTYLNVESGTLEALYQAGCDIQQGRGLVTVEMVDLGIKQAFQEYSNNIMGEQEYQDRLNKYKWLKSFLTTVHPLADHCRRVIRRQLMKGHMGQDLIPLIQRVELPHVLTDFLCFNS